MSFTVQHKRSIVEGRRPSADSLAEGQLGVNLHNNTPGLFIKTGTDEMVKIGPCAVGTSAPALDDNSSYCVGELWLDITANANQLKVWDGVQWRTVSA